MSNVIDMNEPVRARVKRVNAYVAMQQDANMKPRGIGDTLAAYTSALESKHCVLTQMITVAAYDTYLAWHRRVWTA